MKPKKGPWLASSSFFSLKYSCNSLATFLWYSKVTTKSLGLVGEGVWVEGFKGGVGESEGEGEGDGGGGEREGVEGLLRGPSAWELLIMEMVVLGLKESLEEW